MAQKITEQYRGLRLDIADAVNVVLAERYLTNELLTLDEKDFRVIRPLTSAPLRSAWSFGTSETM